MGVPSRGGKTLVGVPAAAESGGGVTLSRRPGVVQGQVEV